MSTVVEFIAGYVIFLFVISVHECAHAWMADRCGDPTARLMGRMTLDPRPHIDPLGTIFIPLSPLIFSLIRGGGVFTGFSFFGWARPVPVNPARVRRWRIDNILISAAGCASGFLVALLAALALRAIHVIFPGSGAVAYIILRLGAIAIWLSLFNLIPIPPLDGYQIIASALRLDLHDWARAFQSSGPLILLLLINTPVLYAILRPLNAAVSGFLFGGIVGI